MKKKRTRTWVCLAQGRCNDDCSRGSLHALRQETRGTGNADAAMLAQALARYSACPGPERNPGLQAGFAIA